MADRVKEASDPVAEAKVLSVAEYKRQEHCMRDALEDDEVREALRCLHHDQEWRRTIEGTAHPAPKTSTRQSAR
jgi:hypothetical protein